VRWRRVLDSTSLIGSRFADPTHSVCPLRSRDWNLDEKKRVKEWTHISFNRYLFFTRKVDQNGEFTPPSSDGSSPRSICSTRDCRLPDLTLISLFEGQNVLPRFRQLPSSYIFPPYWIFSVNRTFYCCKTLPAG
jgi:hypothetical protein